MEKDYNYSSLQIDRVPSVTCVLCLLILQQPGEETEERESLAQMAALAVGEGEEEDESVLRKYSKGISHVESLLALDRLRQVGQWVMKKYTLSQALSWSS